MRTLLLALILALTVTCAAEDVSLTWDASTSEGVEGYNVYRSSVQGGSYTKLNADLIIGLTYTDTTAQDGGTYYYVATAVRDGMESAFSVELEIDLPWDTAPLPPTGLRNNQQGANNTLQWNPVQRATRYAIDFADDPSTWSMQAIVTATEYSFKAHPNGGPRWLGVRAMVDGKWTDRAVIPR